MAISWPARIKDAGGVRSRFHRIIDIVPTILEAAGLKAPDTVDGIRQKPIEGVSMAYTFDKAHADAPTTHKTQYFEMVANRGIYHDGWYANTVPPVPPWVLNAPMPDVDHYEWELYNIAEDYSQYNDLAAKMPEKLKEMQALFLQEAKKYNVLPLDNSQFNRAITPRPSATAGQNVFTYSGVMAGIPLGDAPNILNRSYTITAEVEVPHGGGDGMIVTDGGRFGGYGLYLVKMPVFTYNLLLLLLPRWAGEKPLAAGKHTIVFDFKYDGPGIAKGGTGALKVDGEEVASLKLPKRSRSSCRRTKPSTSGWTSHGGQRPGLSAAVPIQRHNPQGDVRPRQGRTDDGRAQKVPGGERNREGLARSVFCHASSRPSLREAKRRSNPWSKAAAAAGLLTWGFSRQGWCLRWCGVLWRWGRDPWFEPVSRSGVAPDQPHIRSSRFQRLHHDSAFGGGAREAGPFFASAFLSQAIHRFADPDRPGLISPRQIRRGGLRFLGRGQAEVFMTAPSMTTPALVNFHSATNSLRASATISRLRAALPVMPGRRR